MAADLIVRSLRAEDARAFLEVHHAAVRGIAAKDYPADVVEDWAPLPVTSSSIEAFLANPDGEVRIVAEIEGEIVGAGALVIEKNELRACYVSPLTSRQGVGTALVREIERIARQHDLGFLRLDSSVTAELFYRALGYKVRERGVLTRPSGVRMASVTMERSL